MEASDTVTNQSIKKITTTTAVTPSNEIPTMISDKRHIQNDLIQMIDFATTRGIPLPTTIQLIDSDDDATLIANYNTMAKAISPATVQAIKYINHQILDVAGEDKKWYSTPIFAKCLIIAGLALLSLIGISLFPEVNAANQKAGLLSSNGLVLLYNLIFICSAALLGVMFYLLKTINDKIKSYTLLPVDAIEVNSTIIIGVISGFIISELFRFNSGAMNSSIEMQKMTLALLGGFSSDAIFSVLKGIVNKAKTLVSTTAD